jgi:hypothetical protein
MRFRALVFECASLVDWSTDSSSSGSLAVSIGCLHWHG